MEEEKEVVSDGRRLHTSTATVFLSSSHSTPLSLATPPQEAPPPVPEEQAPPIDSDQDGKKVWSTMTTRIETSTSVKQWSTPAEKTVEGQPPGPEDRPNTIEGAASKGNVRAITPHYKLGTEKPSSEMDLGKSGYLPNASGDYKVRQTQDHYKLTVIDPKVRSSANMPLHSSTLPDAKRMKADDFPSQHTKRSFMSVKPLEQRKLRSVETRPVTTSNYLAKSIERHRDAESSVLKDYLKAKEGDANKKWDKPGWPGPKGPDNNDESLRELETIKKSIETLQKRIVRTQSMQELMLSTPEEFSKSYTPLPHPSPSPRDPGWLVKMRSNRYLEEASSSLKKYKSMDYLRGGSPAAIRIPDSVAEVDMSACPEGADPLHWQLRKEFHLTRYSERRSSWQPEETPRVEEQFRELPSKIGRERDTVPLRETTPLRDHSPSSSFAPSDIHQSSQLRNSRSQLLYPPGSTENIASEKKPAERPRERTVYENKPIPPSLVAVNITTGDPGTQPRPSTHDYPERLMSPPPTNQPKGILKQQYSSQQYERVESYSGHREQRDQTQQPEGRPSEQHTQPHRPQENGFYDRGETQTPTTDRMRPGSAYQEMPEAERARIMQENLQKHRQSGRQSVTPKHPVTSFNGPFFKLEELDNGSRPHSTVPMHTAENHMQQSSSTGQHHVHYEQHQQYAYSYDQQNQLQRMRQMSASEAELNTHNERELDPTSPSVVIWPPPSSKSDRPRSQSVMARNITDPDRIDEFRRQKELEREAMIRRENRQQEAMHKQVRAMEVQQQRLYEQQHGVRAPVPIMDTIQPPQQYQTSPQPSQIDYHPSQPYPPAQQTYPPQQQYTHPHPQDIRYTPQMGRDPGPPGPQQVRVFETRPISALSDMMDPRDQMSSPNPTWKRTYIVEKPENVEKNEILTSEDLLEKDLSEVQIDILKRREAFVEKPEQEPEIFRTGRRWQPPPEKPYVWPTLRRPVSVDPNLQPVDFAPGPPHSADEGGYQWEPVVYDPGYKKEHKNFTPQNSPPHSPIRGHGTGPLDEPARRQSKHVIKPSSDGSHRPKPAFGGPRQTPSGGFYPHAPNAIKIIKRRPASSTRDVISPTGQEVEVIHQRNYHRLDDVTSPTPHPPSTLDRRSRKESYSSSHLEGEQINDWEKIYDLPPHSSTIVAKDRPQNVDVKRRLAQFEESARRITGRQASRAQSLTHLDQVPHFPQPDYDDHGAQSHQTNTLPPPRREHKEHREHRRKENREEREIREHRIREAHRRDKESRERQQIPPNTPIHHRSHQQLSRRDSGSSSRVASPLQVQMRQQQHSRQSQQSRQSRSHSRLSQPTTIALSPQPRSETPQALRVRSRMNELTAPSPTPQSYNRARPYLPPPLPGGYRLGDPMLDPRAISPSQGNTRRLVRSVQDQAIHIHSNQTPTVHQNGNGSLVHHGNPSIVHGAPHHGHHGGQSATLQPSTRISSRSNSARDHRNLTSPNPRFL